MGRKKIKVDKDVVRRAYYDEGKSQAEIAKIFGCCGATISKRMKEWGMEARGLGNPHPVSKDYLLREYVENDRPATDIASELGCSPQAIYWHLRKHDIPTRSTSEATILAHKNGCFRGEKTLQIRREQMMGANNPTWKGGNRVDYYGPNWTVQRRRARKRDNYTCQECSVTEDDYGRALDVHHLIPFSEYGLERYKEANHLSNLISYCNSCHMTVERTLGH